MDDLISRAAAIEAIVSLTAFESEDELKKFVGKNACDDYYLGGLCDAIDEIKDTTAVDAVPVVHGRWIYKDRHRKSYRQYTGFDAAGETHTITVLEESKGKDPYCSECGAQAAESFMDFCPRCGAKMDGERRDSE